MRFYYSLLFCFFETVISLYSDIPSIEIDYKKKKKNNPPHVKYFIENTNYREKRKNIL